MVNFYSYTLRTPRPMTLKDPLNFERVFKKSLQDFPGGAVVKNSPANAGDTGSIPGLGRFHMPRSN